MREKTTKVYEVRTGILEQGKNGGDIQNFSGYTVTAKDAKSAIQYVEDTFKFVKGEYVDSVRIVATLD
jgi:hypothetical protein